MLIPSRLQVLFYVAQQNGKKRSFNHPEYRLKKKLGQGGMATVYLATQVKLDRLVAIKIMSPRMSQNESFRKRFVREARTLAKFRHENIITIYEVESIDGLWFLVMEYLESGDLKERMRSGMTRAEILDVIRQTASALDYAHSHNYVHRDIKPENCMFDKTGRLVLTDFGIARTADNEGTQLTRMGVSIGTPSYMAPEQFESSNVDARADIYSLGVMFYELLAGAKPFRSDSAAGMLFKHATEPVPPLPDDMSDLQPLVNWMLAKDPNDRPDTAAEVVQQLDSLINDGNLQVERIKAVPESTLVSRIDREETIVEPTLDDIGDPEPTPGRSALAKLWVPLGLAAGFAIGVGLYLLLSPDRPAVLGTAGQTDTNQVEVIGMDPGSVAGDTTPAETTSRTSGFRVADDVGVIVDLKPGDDIAYAFDSLVLLEQSEVIADDKKMSGWLFFLENYGESFSDHKLVGEALSRVDGWREVMNYADKMVAGEVDSMDFYYRGYGFQMAHQYKRAIADYEEALRLNPDNTFINEFVDQTRALRDGQ